MSSRTVVLGGGFGGISAANTLRGLVGAEHEIVVVDRSSRFTVGAGQTWMALGERRYTEISHSRAALLEAGVRFLEASIEKIDLARRSVITDSAKLEFDQLVIALGADLDTNGVPGLDEAHTFYTAEGAERLRPALAKFHRGDVVVLIPRMPFKCPPAPYEAAMLLHDLFTRRGDSDVRVAVWTVEPQPMPTAGPEMGKFIAGALAQRGIAYHPQKKATRVDVAARRVVFEDGSEGPFDLLITVPIHQAPQVVREAGLVDASGWIPTDAASLHPKTLPEALPVDVYAIGDVTAITLPGRYKPEAALSLPKAGVFAEAQGRVAAQRIAAKLFGRDPSATFDGEGFCYLELGGGIAVRGEGSFFALPHPTIRKKDPDAAQLRDKKEWVDRHLAPVR